MSFSRPSRWLIAPALIAALAFTAAPVQAQNLVSNPGFESGSFSSWTQFGNTQFSGVENANPYSGSYNGFFGPTSTIGTGGISQSIATAIGSSYTFSFWLSNPSGGNPTSAVASWGGTPQLSLSDSPSSLYTYYSFGVTATAASTEIAFTFLNDPYYWYLDDVSVELAESVVPEPATMTLLATGLAGMAAARRKKRQA